MLIEVKTIAGLPAAARQLLDIKNLRHIICLHGEMGAGKTTFLQTICKELGVRETMGSPTYTLVNEYKSDTSGKTIYHFDFYRISDEKEALDMGIYEYFDSGNLCLIEWPEKIKHILEGENVMNIYIRVTGDGSREVEAED